MKRLFDNVNEETYNSCFLACVIVCFLFSCIILGATYISNRQAAKDMNEMSNMIIAYIATATDDEYDQIAEEIRHDFIFRKWDERTRQFVQISQTRLHIVRDSYLDYDTLSLRQERNVVSIHRMKNIFCDDCIDKILSTIDGQTITSFVFFSAGDNVFYPVSDGQEIQGDDYSISVYYDRQDDEMQIQYNFS